MFSVQSGHRTTPANAEQVSGGLRHRGGLRDRFLTYPHVSNLDVPDINTVPDALLWAANVADGEAARVAEGGTPLAWPSAAEVAAESGDLAFNRSQQTTAKTFYDQLQEAIAAQRPTVDALIRDLWDTIEYNLRNEPTQSSLRRNAREWGVVYDGEEPEEETPEPTPPNP